MTKDIDFSNLNYYEQEPEENTFSDIVIDLTHRCNMECKNCYIPNRLFPDMEFEKFYKWLGRLSGRCMIRLVGAEPTLHPHIDKFINATTEFGHMNVLCTNGLRLSSNNFAKRLSKTTLRAVYISLNGVDNDDWYEEIDELRCAKKKIQAVQHIKDFGFSLDTGTIIVKGINEEAPSRLLHLMNDKDIDTVTMRIKNVGQLGRYQKDEDENIKLKGLVTLCSQQFNLSKDYIWSHYDKVHRYGGRSEPGTIEFPMDEGNTDRYNKRWIKITDWDTDNDVGIPDPGSQRRGRLTENWTIAPMYEHIKMNEGNY